MKQLLEFSQIGQSQTGNEYCIRVSVFDIDGKEVKEIRKELDSLPATVKYTMIEIDGIGAEILGTYEKVLESLRILEETGWGW